MRTIEDLLAKRRLQPAYDEELWDFMEAQFGRNLMNLSLDELQQRLHALERNTLYLDNGQTPRDDLHADRGWLSPWWWLRVRHWTIREFEHRGAKPVPTQPIAEPAALRDEFVGVNGGGSRLLVRIGSTDWLPDMLSKGRLRFVRASWYRNAGLDVARRDDELSKAYKRPGQALRISMADGAEMKAIGDVEFASKRAVESGGALREIEYWLCSFSSELDPRLFQEFKSDDPAKDAVIVIFEPDAFVRQALTSLNRAAPVAVKQLFPINYYDPRYPPRDRLSPLNWKTFEFALQQEMRFALDPEDGPALSATDEFFVEIGSINAIAGVYRPDGVKLAGAGPDSFMKR
ncbi:MAG: hypothetical protein JWM02_3592 [Frankiales bacterium]|nr:hypothetical protein [Frankiales bacterium]